MTKKTTHSGMDITSLSRDVQRLSRLLTRGREDLPAAYLKDPALRNAYLHYFFPANRAKVHLPLAELGLHPKGIFERKQLRILDIGSGPGTSVLGILDHFSLRGQAAGLSFTAIDPVQENLTLLESLYYAHPASRAADGLRVLKARIEDLPAGLSGAYDLIVLSNVVNELFAGREERIERRSDIIDAILGKTLAADGSCIIIEPALRETSRDLLMLRDVLRGRGLTVYSPCLGKGACPAIGNPKDWCHEDIPWDPPEVVREVDKLIGLRKDSLKFSYLVLRKDGRSLTDVFGEDTFRVVSEPLVSKGKLEFYLCGAGGRKLAMRQDKDRTGGNDAFGVLMRGMIVRCSGLEDEGKRFKVLKETVVAVLFPNKESAGPTTP